MKNLGMVRSLSVGILLLSVQTIYASADQVRKDLVDEVNTNILKSQLRNQQSLEKNRDTRNQIHRHVR